MKKLFLICGIISLSVNAAGFSISDPNTHKKIDGRETGNGRQPSFPTEGERGGGHEGREIGNGREGTIFQVYFGVVSDLSSAVTNSTPRGVSRTHDSTAGIHAVTKIIDFVKSGRVVAVPNNSIEIRPGAESSVHDGRLYVNEDLFHILVLQSSDPELRMIRQLLAATGQADNGLAEELVQSLKL